MADSTVAQDVAKLAKIALASSLGDWKGAGTAAAELVAGKIAAWLTKGELTDLNYVLHSVEADLEAAFVAEGIDPATVQIVMELSALILSEHGLSFDQFASLDLDPKRAAATVIAGAVENIADMQDQYVDICEFILMAYYKSIASHKEAIEKIRASVNKVVLNRLTDLSLELAKLPDRLSDALEKFASRAILVDRTKKWKPEFASTAVLTADYMVVPFYGREDLVEDVNRWCDREQAATAVRLYTGPGGIGKTRAFMQLVKCRKENAWTSGFLDRSFKSASPGIVDRIVNSHDNLMIVVDYAETRVGEVTLLLYATLARRTSNKVRIVLLARSAGDWWRKLKNESGDVGAFLQGRMTNHLSFSSLKLSNPDRLQLFKLATQAFSCLLGGEQQTSNFVPDLQHKHFDNPLFIHMAAFAAVHGKGLNTATELLDFVVAREKRLLSDALKQVCVCISPDKLMSGAAAQATLVGGIETDGEANALLGRTPFIRDQLEVVRHCIAEILHEFYGGVHWIESIQPDLVGEHFVESEIQQELLDVALAPESHEIYRTHAIAVLARLSQREPAGERWLRYAVERHIEDLAGIALRVAMETGGRLGRIVAESLEQKQDAKIAADFLRVIPHRTVSLKRLGYVASRILYKKSLERHQSSSEPFGIEHATVAADYSRWSGAIGRRTEALAPILEALDVRRQNCGADDDAARVELAHVLESLSERYSALGQRAAAHDAIEEAVGIWRQLSSRRPAEFTHELAKSLDSLSLRLADLGRRAAALSAAEEAVTVWQRLSDEPIKDHRAEKAKSLSILANRLANSGRRADALELLNEAVAICRELSAWRPDAFQPDLAEAINDLSVRLADLGRRGEALACAEEAAAIRQELTEKELEVFEPDLASSLHTLSVRLADVGRRAEALAPIEESVAIRRRLAEKEPTAFEPVLAVSLHTFSVRLAGVGRRAEALASVEEAVAIRRRLAGKEPAAFEPALAGALHALSIRLAEVGRRAEALAPIEEAVAIRRRLAGKEPATFEPVLAGSLHALSIRLAEVGRRTEALAPIEEAVAIWRRLAGKEPGLFEPELAHALGNLSIRLADMGRRTEALTPIEEAVAIRRRFAEKSRELWLPSLAKDLQHLSSLLPATHSDQALEVATEAIDLLVDAVNRNGHAAHELAGALQHLNGLLRRADRQALDRSMPRAYLAWRLLRRVNRSRWREIYIEFLKIGIRPGFKFINAAFYVRMIATICIEIATKQLSRLAHNERASDK